MGIVIAQFYIGGNILVLLRPCFMCSKKHSFEMVIFVKWEISLLYIRIRMMTNYLIKVHLPYF